MEQNTKLRVAAYCRVSTRLEAQEGSFEIQKDYFRRKIESNPSMVMVGVYGDNGKSGLHTNGREGLKQLLGDCEAGKVDVILTKSISRLSRSMADCLEIIQKLRGLNVNIVFEKENLHSNDVHCDLLIHILAAMAQEESNSISQNVSRSHAQCAAEGRPFGRVSYGYVPSGANRWQVNPQEAKRVQCAFYMAAKGFHYQEILNTLNQMEAEEHTGTVWLQKRLKHLLQNVSYLGDYFSHGTICLTPGHQVANKGYRDRFYIEEHHEPLVSKAQFDRVQEMIQKGVLISYLPMTPEKEAMIRDDEWERTA